MSEEREFLYPVRVEWEDTDAGGVVYHSNYINFMERARSATLRELGCRQREMRSETGVVIVVTSLSIDYRRPAVLEDELLVRTRMTKVGRASAELEQTIWRGEELLTRGTVKVAAVSSGPDGRPKPVAIPATLKASLADNIASPLFSDKKAGIQ